MDDIYISKISKVSYVSIKPLITFFMDGTSNVNVLPHFEKRVRGDNVTVFNSNPYIGVYH